MCYIPRAVALNPVQVQRYKLTNLCLTLLREIDDLFLIANKKTHAIGLKRFVKEWVCCLAKLCKLTQSLADCLMGKVVYLAHCTQNMRLGKVIE